MDSLFACTRCNSPIHRAPAWIKLLVLLATPVTIHLTPIYVCFSLMAFYVLLALVSRMGFTRFLRDLRPIAVYCVMISMIDVLSWVFFNRERDIVTQTSMLMMLRLVCATEAASVFFRTTGTYEIGNTLRGIEKAITFGHTKYAVSGMFTLFLSFLPQIFRTWSGIDAAYRSRGGRRGIRKVLVLLPVLITISMKKAETTRLSLLARD
jgi:energy-coupling factor transporter transmembrane protein EcfT